MCFCVKKSWQCLSGNIIIAVYRVWCLERFFWGSSARPNTVNMLSFCLQSAPFKPQFPTIHRQFHCSWFTPTLHQHTLIPISFQRSNNPFQQRHICCTSSKNCIINTETHYGKLYCEDFKNDHHSPWTITMPLTLSPFLSLFLFSFFLSCLISFAIETEQSISTGGLLVPGPITARRQGYFYCSLRRHSYGCQRLWELRGLAHTPPPSLHHPTKGNQMSP